MFYQNAQALRVDVTLICGLKTLRLKQADDQYRQNQYYNAVNKLFFIYRFAVVGLQAAFYHVGQTHASGFFIRLFGGFWVLSGSFVWVAICHFMVSVNC